MAKTRDYITGAIEMAIFVDGLSQSIPQHPYTFNVIKQGNFWEIVFIFTAGYEEKPSGVRLSGKDEYVPFEVTGEIDPIQLTEDFELDEILLPVSKALEEIYKNEYRG